MELKLSLPTPFGLAPALIQFEPGHRGTVLLYHGLGASKEVQRPEAAALTAAGLLVVTMDAWGHGERRLDDFDRRMDDPDGLAHVVKCTVDEVPTLIDTLEGLLGTACGAFGVAGISMGGCIAFGAAVKEPRLTAVVSILGSPDWSFRHRTTSATLLAESPHLHAARIVPKAVLALNAGLDTHVPPESARRFMDELRPSYRNAPERLEYVEYPDSTHFMREADWHDLWNRTVGWLQRWLR